MTKAVLISSLFTLSGLVLQAQDMHVTIQRGTPVIRYELSQGERVSDVYKRFGLTGEIFKQLNPVFSEDSSHYCLLSFRQVMLVADPDGTGKRLVLQLNDPVSWETVSQWMGLNTTSHLKRMNPDDARAHANEKITVGYLPIALFNAIIYPDESNKDERTQLPAENFDTLHTNRKETSIIPSFYADQFTGINGSVVSGKVAAFKTEAGWQDARFYILMDNIVPGTVVRIGNRQNKRFIFAKVLGELPDMRQNQNLEARINSAAAAALDITEGVGEVEISW